MVGCPGSKYKPKLNVLPQTKDWRQKNVHSPRFVGGKIGDTGAGTIFGVQKTPERLTELLIILFSYSCNDRPS